MKPNQEIWLIRHAEVALRWKGICYGSMDVSLSDAGKQASERLAGSLVRWLKPRVVYHSGLSRTKYLANHIGILGCGHIEVREDTRLRERNYGIWEGLHWDAAYESDPDHFHDLIHKPNSYRPQEGETTSEMQQRMIAWLNEIEVGDRPIIGISHSGPIASLAGYLQGLHATQWESCMTRNLEGICLGRSQSVQDQWFVKCKRELSVSVNHENVRE